jgi:hypothetical protein
MGSRLDVTPAVAPGSAGSAAAQKNVRIAPMTLCRSSIS